MKPHLCLLFSGLNKTRGLSCFPYAMPSGHFNISVALLWMFSNGFMTFLYRSAQNWTQCSKWGSANTAQNRTVPFLDQFTVFCLMHPRVWLPGHTGDSYSTYHQRKRIMFTLTSKIKLKALFVLPKLIVGFSLLSQPMYTNQREWSQGKKPQVLNFS